MTTRTDINRQLATSCGIRPDRCSRCDSTTGNWSGPGVDGTDQAADTGDLIWQCGDCGQWTSMASAEIRRRSQLGGGRSS